MIPGKLLTAEQSVRLSMMDSSDRDALIDAIVAGMRQTASRKRRPSNNWSPHLFYSQLVKRL